MSENKDLNNLISRAIKKVNGTKENDLCKYIPQSSGGYIHHFTFRKMKSKNPGKISAYIEKYIINSPKPVIIAPKKRAARGSRKKRDQIIFSRMQLERMLNIARLAGDKEIIGILSPKKSLAGAKRDLVQAIRNNRVEPEYWNAYVEAVNALSTSIKSENQLTQS